jgi:hypothetical protein
VVAFVGGVVALVLSARARPGRERPEDLQVAEREEVAT